MGFSTVPCNEFVEVLASKARFRVAAAHLLWLEQSEPLWATW